MKVLLLKGHSRNDVLRVFVDRLSQAFLSIEAVAVDVINLPVFSSHKLNDVIELLSGYDAIISFNAIQADCSVEHNGQTDYLFNILKTKHICWMVDDIVYHLARLQAPNPNRITLCTSEQHIQTANALGLDGVWLQRLAAGDLCTEIKPHAARQYDVAIAVSWMGKPEKFWLHFESNIQQAIEDTLICLDHTIICNAFPIFSKKIRELNLCLTDKTLQYLLSEIHSYIRKRDRQAIIDRIIESGISVALIGSGWTDLCFKRSNVTTFDDVHYSEIGAIYQEARIVVNLNAENGACERVFDGIESGAMIFSDFSNALYQIFSHDNGVLFYQKHRSEESIQALLHILAQGKTETLARKAQVVVSNGQTWKHRATELYQLLK
jgi:hypothetical protein